MAQVFVLSGPDIGRSFTIAHGDTLGRSPECIVTLKHASLSRKHAHFECEGERWFVVDDDSRNGVLVGKQRVKRAELADMAEFQLGELHLRFRSQSPVEERPRSAPAVAPAVAPPSPSEIRLEDVDEIELEGDDDEPVITAGGGARAPVLRPEGDSPYAAAGPFALPKDESAPSSRRPGPPPSAPRKLEDVPASASVTSRAPAAPPVLQHTMLDTAFGRGAAAAAGANISRSTRKPGDRILQYNKVEGGGVELAQLSAPVRYALYVLGIGLMATVAWLAFQATSKVKGRVLGGGEGLEADGEPLSDETPR